jgi:hypothetical protein
VTRKLVWSAFIFGLLVLAVGACDSGTAPSAGAGGAAVSEVDFGFAELHPGQPGVVTSYKHGKPMVLYNGDEFDFRVIGKEPAPPLELRVGDQVQPLPESAGKIKIAGPPNKPLPVTLIAKGERVSLPGGAPPAISVKVQVYGAPRPK